MRAQPSCDAHTRTRTQATSWSQTTEQMGEPLVYTRWFGRGDDTVGNPHRAQTCKFELFELIILLKLDIQFSIEQFEPTLPQSTVSSPPLSSISSAWLQVADKASESASSHSKQLQQCGTSKGLPSGIILENWNDAENISMAPEQGRHAHIEKCKQFWQRGTSKR